MRRIVVDTNVFVAAGFNPRSAAARILTAVREGRFQLIWNEPTRRETELIMRQIPPLDWERVADLSRPEMEFLDPSDPERFVFVPDPEDRKIRSTECCGTNAPRHQRQPPSISQEQHWHRRAHAPLLPGTRRRGHLTGPVMAWPDFPRPCNAKTCIISSHR